MTLKITNLFYIKRAKANSQGLMPIFQRITIDGKRIEKSTGKYILEDSWSAETSKVKGKSEQARSINSHLDRCANDFIEAQAELLFKRKSIDYTNLKAVLIGKIDKPRTLISVFSEHNLRIKALVSVGEYAIGTVKRYEVTLRHMQKFLQWKYNSHDISLAEIDYAFIMDFDFFLRTYQNCRNNTAIKYVKNFRKIFNICLDNEWLLKDPFKKYKPKPTIVDRDYLNEDELNRIIKKNFQTSRLQVVRDIFIFSCFTGLAYVDVQNLTPENLSVGIDGDIWIFTKREKTDGPSNIPLLDVPMNIIEAYKDHPKCLNSNRLLPILSNQRMNSYLKEIGDVCNITKDLTFHMARHTFATTVTLSNGVPLESVSKMLGHRSLKSTQIYARVLDIKVSRDMQNLKNKFNYPADDNPRALIINADI